MKYTGYAVCESINSISVCRTLEKHFAFDLGKLEEKRLQQNATIESYRIIYKTLKFQTTLEHKYSTKRSQQGMRSPNTNDMTVVRMSYCYTRLNLLIDGVVDMVS